MKKSFMIALSAGMLFLLGGCGHRRSAEEKVQNVKVSEVVRCGDVRTKSYTGIIGEANETNLAFMVAGKIKEIRVKEGQFVRKGDKLAVMDDRDYRIQYEADRANYEQVVEEVRRVKEMYKRNNVSQNDYDKAVAGEKMITAKLQHSKDQLEDTVLEAPFDGYVQKISYSADELVDAGMPIMKLLDISSFRVSIDIPASLYVKRHDFLSFKAVPDVLPEESFDLEISNVSPKANGNLLYRIYFDLKKDAKLAPGMTVNVEIAYRTGDEDKFLVPVGSVFEKGGKSYVWTVAPDGKSVEKREVTVGEIAGDGNIRILDGLREGEKVVSAGVGFISESIPVRIIDSGSRTNVGNLL